MGRMQDAPYSFNRAEKIDDFALVESLGVCSPERRAENWTVGCREGVIKNCKGRSFIRLEIPLQEEVLVL